MHRELLKAKQKKDSFTDKKEMLEYGDVECRKFNYGNLMKVKAVIGMNIRMLISIIKI